MIVVPVKLFSILMNLGKIVLQVAVVLTKLSSKNIFVRKLVRKLVKMFVKILFINSNV